MDRNFPQRVAPNQEFGAFSNLDSLSSAFESQFSGSFQEQSHNWDQCNEINPSNFPFDRQQSFSQNVGPIESCEDEGDRILLENAFNKKLNLSYKNYDYYHHGGYKNTLYYYCVNRKCTGNLD